MFALDFLPEALLHENTDGTPRAVSNAGGISHRRRSSIGSVTGSELSKLKPPRTEGHIKWLRTLECGSEVMCTRFSRDGQLVAAGLANGVVKVFQLDGTLIYALSDEDTARHKLPVTSLQFVPWSPTQSDDTHHLLMSTYASGMVKFWHYSSGKALSTIVEEGPGIVRQSLCSGFSCTGERFAVGGADPAIHCYDAQTKQKIISLEPSDGRDVMNGHRLRVFSLQYHPNEPHLMVSGGWDDTVQFWDDRTPHAVRRIYGPHICGDALDIDGMHNHLITGSWRKDNVLQIWDMNTGNKIKDVPQDALHKCMLYCCQWLGRDYIICGGNEQNMARIIDRGTLNTVAQVFDLEQGVYCIDNDRGTGLPKISIGAATSLYLFRQEKRT